MVIDNYKGRIIGLDILRSFAIITVLYSHSLSLLPYIPQFLNELNFDGVIFFFVLSGYLIGSILIKMIIKNDINFKSLLNFWVRRWFRTLPMYFFVLLVSILLFQKSLYDYKSYFLFIQNINSPHPNFFNEAWSLAVEEWFYLITPIGMFLIAKYLSRYKMKLIPIFFGAIIIIVAFIRFHKSQLLINNVQLWDIHLRKEVITRLDSIMIGVIGAWILYFYLPFFKKNRKLLFFISLTCILLLHFIIVNNESIFFKKYSFFMNVVYFPFESFLILTLIPYLLSIKINKKSYLFKIITKISIFSYSMYLLNCTIVLKSIIPFISKALIFMNGRTLIVTQFLLFWILTYVLSALIYSFYELPMMNIRDTFKTNLNE